MNPDTHEVYEEKQEPKFRLIGQKRQKPEVTSSLRPLQEITFSAKKNVKVPDFYETKSICSSSVNQSEKRLVKGNMKADNKVFKLR